METKFLKEFYFDRLNYFFIVNTDWFGKVCLNFVKLFLKENSISKIIAIKNQKHLLDYCYPF